MRVVGASAERLARLSTPWSVVVPRRQTSLWRLVCTTSRLTNQPAFSHAHASTGLRELRGRTRSLGGIDVPVNASPDHKLRDIQAITDSALSRLDAESLLTELLERTKDVLGADTAVVLLLDHAARELVATASSGLDEEVRQGVRVALGAGFAGRVAAERQPVILDRVDESTVVNPILAARGITNLMGVPMIVGGRLLGVMHVGSLTGRRFAAEDVALLQLAADRAAAAVSGVQARTDRIAAGALQRSLLPSALPEVDGAELAARFLAG